MPTREELDFIASSLRRNGTVQLSAVVALEIRGDAKQKHDFEEALVAIRDQPVDAPPPSPRRFCADRGRVAA